MNTMGCFCVIHTISGTHHLLNGGNRPILIIGEFNQMDASYGPDYVKYWGNERKVQWITNNITLHQITDYDVGSDYIISMVGRYPTLLEFHMASIQHYNFWAPSVPDATPEMLQLHKLLWEI